MAEKLHPTQGLIAKANEAYMAVILRGGSEIEAQAAFDAIAGSLKPSKETQQLIDKVNSQASGNQ